jgi:hypothetical protein
MTVDDDDDASKLTGARYSCKVIKTACIKEEEAAVYD